ncbi:hypothetical protein CR513_19271, partial [Mucuna pruriens]
MVSMLTNLFPIAPLSPMVTKAYFTILYPTLPLATLQARTKSRSVSTQKKRLGPKGVVPARQFLSQPSLASEPMSLQVMRVTQNRITHTSHYSCSHSIPSVVHGASIRRLVDRGGAGLESGKPEVLNCFNLHGRKVVRLITLEFGDYALIWWTQFLDNMKRHGVRDPLGLENKVVAVDYQRLDNKIIELAYLVRQLAIRQHHISPLILRKHKKAIGWTLVDLLGVNPSICMHKILLEEEARPVRQPQRRLNPTILDVVKE